jgi:aspartate 1-decarboxylase
VRQKDELPSQKMSGERSFQLIRQKLSAIHNLVVEDNCAGRGEGISIPSWLLHIADIKNHEEIIITKIGAGSWKNRVRTFVIEASDDTKITVFGSLAHFLQKGDITCVIAESYNDEDMTRKYRNDEYPIFDVGFNPQDNSDNSHANLNLQYFSHTVKNVTQDTVISDAVAARNILLRSYIDSLVIGLRVNKTHPDCLQGSAELPESVMKAAKIDTYRSVSVLNVTSGGVADTYAVPMPEGVVMTTGAMASFAKLGENVNVASYSIRDTAPRLITVETDGARVYQ